MKILVIGMTKLKYMPYMDFYLNQIDFNKNDVHIIYWDRDGKEEKQKNYNIKYHCFCEKMQDESSLLKKSGSLIKFKFFAKKVISKIKPDFIIVHYQTTALLLLENLLFKHRERYILDYRDITYDKNIFFKSVVSSCVNNSRHTFISSDGFRSFLPSNNKIITTHNISEQTLQAHSLDSKPKNKNGVIKISFWGLIRDKKLNEQIVESLARDKRFELHYYGKAEGQLLSMLENASDRYSNIYYHGEYLSEERNKFARDTDLIHNIYDNHSSSMPYAMSNKFYDSLIYYIPQLCMKQSFMANETEKYNVGYQCNPFDHDFADQVYLFYKNLDYQQFYQNCDKALGLYLNQMKKGQELVNNCFNEEKKEISTNESMYV